MVFPFEASLLGGAPNALGPLDEFPSRPQRKTKAAPFWQQMPEFTQTGKTTFYSITVRFINEKDRSDFAALLGQKLTENTRSVHFHKTPSVNNKKLRWIEPAGNTNPAFPVYIVSKGRSQSMLTSKALRQMKVPHFIAVEPPELDSYKSALAKFDLQDYATLITTPFENHGDGPGRARNWVWDHSVDLDAKKHWVLDDNIGDFYRLNRNMRIRVDSGAIFKAAEDFVDRFENVPLAGFQYRHFIAPDSAYPAYVTNTRIYSTLLVDNDCPYRWRGRYNEDTDLSLRILCPSSELLEPIGA